MKDTVTKVAIVACTKMLEKGRVIPFRIRAVLRCTRIDVSPIEKFMSKSHPPHVRLAAMDIIGQKGDVGKLLDMAQVGDLEREEMMVVLKHAHRAPDRVDELADLLGDEDPVLIEAAIDTFRRAGREDALFVLLLDGEEALARRAKRYMRKRGS